MKKQQTDEKEAPRTPGPKFRNVLPEGFKIRRSPSPMADMLNAAAAEETEHEPTPTHPNPPQPTPIQLNPTAPARDFNKRANSLERDALPKGMFPGTSKKLYDALYLRTRGAHQPTRTIQATKRELMTWSGIKSKNTIAVNLHILVSMGLVIRQIEIGDHEGSVYEILLPEEANNQDPTQPNPTQPNPTQKLGWDPPQKLGWVGLGNPIENTGTYAFPKTSFKTEEKNIDDEAFAGLVAAIKATASELTGREPAKSEADKWRELGELLMIELKIAAARTSTISSVPAFLAEHLRRRLWKMDRKPQLDTPDATGDKSIEEQGTTAPVKDCADCGGSGWWYPEGYEGGVAKCRHVRLKASQTNPDI